MLVGTGWINFVLLEEKGILCSFISIARPCTNDVWRSYCEPSLVVDMAFFKTSMLLQSDEAGPAVKMVPGIILFTVTFLSSNCFSFEQLLASIG